MSLARTFQSIVWFFLVGHLLVSFSVAQDSTQTISIGNSVSSSEAPSIEYEPLKSVPAPTLDSNDTSTNSVTKKKRKRFFQESRIHTIDDIKKQYRSPKRALFMSFLIPGLGQAYVGNHWSNYLRGGLYFAADIALGFGWYHYTVVKHDREVRRYEKYADTHYSLQEYEDKVAENIGDNTREDLDALFPSRSELCGALYEDRTTTDAAGFFATCREYGNGAPVYQNTAHYGFTQNEPFGNASEVGEYRRDNIHNLQSFYTLIGQNDDLIWGWSGDIVDTTNASRQEYLDIRKKAADYARMQSLFLGGILLNHLISAVDAAIAARLHNKSLYQEDVKWYDRVRLNGYMAYEGWKPRPTVVATLPF